MEPAAITEILTTAGYTVLGIDGGVLVIEDPSCIKGAIENFIKLATAAILTLGAMLVFGWGFALIRGSEIKLFDNTKNLAMLLMGLGLAPAIMQLLVHNDMLECRKIKISLNDINSSFELSFIEEEIIAKNTPEAKPEPEIEIEIETIAANPPEEAGMTVVPIVMAPIIADNICPDSPAWTYGTIGRLSERFESGCRGPGVINARMVDGRYVLSYPGDPGGFSYGVWQISTNTGTMNAFMNHLQRNNPEFYRTLTAAGGNAAATRGDAGFINAWRNLATADPVGFRQAQYEFIYASHFTPRVNFVNQNFSALNLENRNPIIMDAIWSIGVQHGGANTVLGNALRGRDLANMSDADVLRNLYGARMDYVRGIQTLGQNAINNEMRRYETELAMALSQI